MSCLLPGGAVLGILEDYALCGKLIPYLIGTGVILILLGFGTLRNELFDIFLERVAVLNLFGDEAEGKHPVEILNDLYFGIARRMLLECIIQDGEGQRGIEVVAESGVEFLTQGRDGGLVDLAIAGLQGGDLGQELLVGPGCISSVGFSMRSIT